MIPLPGYTTKESITLLMEALRDPSNISIASNIRRALRNAGVSSQVILYYETHGQLPIDEDEDQITRPSFDVDKMYNEMIFGDTRRVKLKLNKILAMMLTLFLLLIGAGMMIVIFSLSTDNGNDSTTEPPAITEMAPVEEGNKL
jgi:hypothetical protein